MTKPGEPRPPAKRGYGWIVGVAGAVLIVYVLLNTLRTDGPGASGLAEGIRLPPFATPLVLSKLDGDANVARHSDSGGAGKVAACTVVRPDVLNSCTLGHDHPLVIGFLFTRGAKCASVFDAMQKASRTYPDVRFAGVVVKGDRDEARTLVRKQGWTFPVGYDRDGGIANVYGIAVCPELVFAYPGGVVRETAIGENLAKDLGARVRALEAGAKARGWKPS